MEDSLPVACDFEMALERFLAMNFVKENPQIFAKHKAKYKRTAIPNLLSPTYIFGSINYFNF